MLRNAMTFTFQGTPNLFIRYTYGAFITMGQAGAFPSWRGGEGGLCA